MIKDEWGKSRGGGKLLVYMSSGIPIVSSAYGIGNQIVTNNYNGILVNNNEEWYNALELLICNEKLRDKMSKNSRKTAVTQFSHWAYLSNFLKLVNET